MHSVRVLCFTIAAYLPAIATILGLLPWSVWTNGKSIKARQQQLVASPSDTRLYWRRTPTLALIRWIDLHLQRSVMGCLE